jgi:hypothetical protein
MSVIVYILPMDRIGAFGQLTMFRLFLNAQIIAMANLWCQPISFAMPLIKPKPVMMLCLTLIITLPTLKFSERILTNAAS